MSNASRTLARRVTVLAALPFAATLACIPLAPNAIHGGGIELSETWRKADNPHLIESDVVVEGSGTPVLTIEAGVVVRFAAGTSLRIGNSGAAAIKILGTKDDPVKFVADDPTNPRGYYAGLDLQTQTTPASTIEFLEMTSCGGDNYGGREQACINLTGSGVSVKFSNVTIDGSAAIGVASEYGAVFAPGSTNLVVKNGVGAPLYFDTPNEVGTIPAGSRFEDNERNVISMSAGDVLSKTQTWANFGIPYQTNSTLSVGSDESPVLTLAAGVRMIFGSHGALTIGENGYTGNLKTLGTAEAPVVFSADTTEPFPGHWGGLRVGPYATPATRIEHAVVEFAGRGMGQAYDDAGIQVQGDKGEVIRSSTIRNNKGCGVLRVTLGEAFPTDFTAPSLGNVFENNQAGAQCTW